MQYTDVVPADIVNETRVDKLASTTIYAFHPASVKLSQNLVDYRRIDKRYLIQLSLLIALTAKKVNNGMGGQNTDYHVVGIRTQYAVHHNTSVYVHQCATCFGSSSGIIKNPHSCF
jgi:hypothetical protein